MLLRAELERTRAVRTNHWRAETSHSLRCEESIYLGGGVSGLEYTGAGSVDTA